MREVHLVVPEGFDDPRRPSGGNAYDRRVARDLAAAGWRVHPHPVVPDTVARTLTALPERATVLVDGLVGSAAESAMLPQARRLRLVVLMHLAQGCGPEADAGLRRVEAAVLGACCAVITTSEWTRRWLLEHYHLAPEAVRVARPGVDLASVDLAGAVTGTQSGVRLVCVGAIAPHKGQDLLVASLIALRDTLPDLDWCCTLVGPLDRDPGFVAGLLHQVRTGGIADRVRFTGAMSEADLQATYAASDLLVLPSRTESYGMVVTEALAHGLPIVATAVGGVPEAFAGPRGGPSPGTLVPPDRSEALTQALRDWLTEPQTRLRWRQAAQQRRLAMTPWSTTVEQVSQVLSEVST